MLSFLLVPIYTAVMPPGSYGEVTLIFSWFAIFNVFLAYGMETAFFRFYKEKEQRARVVTTALISITVSTLLFFGIALFFQGGLAGILNIAPNFIPYVLCILALDALVIIPFAWLRAEERPMRYAVIKILNVGLNLGLNLFFLMVLPKLAGNGEVNSYDVLYREDFEISYILISNLIASGITLALMFPAYLDHKYQFDWALCAECSNTPCP